MHQVTEGIVNECGKVVSVEFGAECGVQLELLHGLPLVSGEEWGRRIPLPTARASSDCDDPHWQNVFESIFE